MDCLIIRCKDCGAVFYAATRIGPSDVLDIVKYAKQGHEAAVVDAGIVRLAASCACGGEYPQLEERWVKG